MRIVVLDHHGIGDVIMSLPLLDGLRSGYPRAKITVVVKSEVEASLVRTAGVDQTLNFHREAMGPLDWMKFLASLVGRCDLLIAALNTNARAANRLAKFIFAKRTVGHEFARADLSSHDTAGHGRGGHKERGHFDVRVPAPHLHKVSNNLEILRALGLPIVTSKPRLDLPEGVPQLGRALLDSDLPILALHVGTGTLVGARRFDLSIANYKEAPLSLFCSVLKELSRRRAFGIMLVGAPQDCDRGETLRAALPPQLKVFNLSGKCSILDTARLIRSAGVFLGADSGLGHIAAAVGTPVVSLFGPTSPEITAPYGDCVTIIRSESCALAPCYPEAIYRCEWPECDALSEGRQVRRCMGAISTTRVVQAVEEQLWGAAQNARSADGG